MKDKVTFIDGEFEEYHHHFSIGRRCRLNLVTMKIVNLQELNCVVHAERPEKVLFNWETTDGKHHSHELEEHAEGHWTVVNPFKYIDGEPKWFTSDNPDGSGL